MSGFDLPRIDRRTTLTWLSAAVSWSAMHGHALAAARKKSNVRRFEPVAKGYGSDPDLLHPKVTWDRTMTLDQLRQCAVLADLILPPSMGAPAPSAVGVADFIDEWISAPYATQVKDRPLILNGLARLDEQASRRFTKSWLASSELERVQLLDEIAAEPVPVGGDTEHQFFLRTRYLVVGAYYSTEAGWKEIGYVGNVPLAAFAPVSPQVMAMLDERLRKLGV